MRVRLHGHRGQALTSGKAPERQPAQQKRFTDLAFRSYDGKPGAGLTQANGLLPDQKFTAIDPPAPAVLSKALATWDAQRKRARVLLLFDISTATTGADYRQLRSSLAAGLALSP